jgi:prepilin-type N-terminal cleavage/methylation domain-containing protein
MKRNRGFTLIEVLVAMVIMTGGIIVMANAWSGNFARVRSARINNNIANLLEQKMTEIEVEYQDKSIDEVKDADSGDFGPLYPGYRWEMKSQAFEMPDLTGTLTAKDGGADSMLITIVSAMTEYFKQSVKEVSVTVFFKSKKGTELKHAVTTYLIDYTKELPMPGLGGGGGGGTGGGTGGGPGGTTGGASGK